MRARKEAHECAFFTFVYGPCRRSHAVPPMPHSRHPPPSRGKWKLLIIRNLLKRPWFFNELKRDIPGISHKMLTASLRELEGDRLIRREEISTPRKGVQYSLTELGESLLPLFTAMKEWGGNFIKKPRPSAHLRFGQGIRPRDRGRERRPAGGGAYGACAGTR